MARNRKTAGFSLVEMLLVLAIIGIVSAIAIPSFLGQRRRARVIGDARTNAQVIRLQMDIRFGDNGKYGEVGTTYAWTAASGANAAAKALLPELALKGSSKMDYSVAVGDAGASYVLTVTDPQMADTITFQTNQTGAVLKVLD